MSCPLLQVFLCAVFQGNFHLSWARKCQQMMYDSMLIMLPYKFFHSKLGIKKTIIVTLCLYDGEISLCDWYFKTFLLSFKQLELLDFYFGRPGNRSIGQNPTVLVWKLKIISLTVEIAVSLYRVIELECFKKIH